MPMLRIQHHVPSFEAWKQAFDADPLGREAAGVRRLQIHRSVSDPNLVMIDLHFADRAQAVAFLERLRELWNGPGRAVMTHPQAWIVETVESQTV